MLLPSIRNIGISVFGTFIALSHVLNAYDISRKLPPRGALGVALDYSLVTDWPKEIHPSDNTVPRSWQFSSHLQFMASVDEITDGQLWQIARDAADEMFADAAQYTITRKVPGAMAILAWGQEIILASSQKGLSFSYNYPGTRVLESLRLCQMSFTNSRLEHKNWGMCAEPMAAHLYYATTATNLAAQHARIGTWVLQKGGWKQTDPCGTQVSNEHPR